ncbi:MAG: hypothetical protein HQK83_04740 [Fibrobacteria bacterium]|nr:hypothetical protein [Fibrobacteria bacterium]
MRLFTLILTVLLIQFLFAQEPKGQLKQTSKPAPEVKSAENIFNDIMQTLPQEKQSKIKTAEQQMETHKNMQEDSKEESQAAKLEAQNKKQKHLNGLPDNIRKKVEKAIENMDARIQERKGQLKEIKKRED